MMVRFQRLALGFLLFALGTLFVSVSSAQSHPPSHIKDQESIARDLERAWKELKAKDPVAWEKDRASSVLEAQEALAQFGYGTLFTAALDDRTKEALRKYQDRSGLPVTGDVDARTLLHLQDDQIALQRDILVPSYTFDDSSWNSWVSVRGVWLQPGKEPNANTEATPILVQCVRSARMCVMATAHFRDYVVLDYFEVERWDASQITTGPSDGICDRQTLRISKADQTVLVTSTTYNSACSPGLPNKPVISRLGDPKGIREARLKALSAAKDRILLFSPEVKGRLGSQDH